MAIGLRDNENRWGIAKLLREDENGNLRIQWYGNATEHTRPGATYKPGWMNPDGTCYWGDRVFNDPPYTNEETDTSITEGAVVLHRFELTREGRLSVPLRRALNQTWEDWNEFLAGNNSGR